MIRLKQAVIVEGRYDKITLDNVIDTLIIPTNGFSIFKDKEKCRLIRTLAQKDGIIVMTDSDSAGGVIRAYIKKIVGDGQIINVYVPQLRGKEKRKATAGKEGLLGVEGMPQEVIEAALQKSGVFAEKTQAKKREITKGVMFSLGLSGADGSAEERRRLLRYLELPENLSPNAMLDILNVFYSADEFERVVSLWRQEADKK